MASNNLQNSLAGITTPQDLKAIIVDVRRYAKWFAATSVKAKVTGTPVTDPIVISEAATTVVKETADGKPMTQAMLDKLIEDLQELETAMPRIVVTLAAMPGNKLKASIVEWCRKNIDPALLVDFRFNATILGGMVVQYGSHVYDWSWRRQILSNRAKFPEVLRRV